MTELDKRPPSKKLTVILWTLAGLLFVVAGADDNHNISYYGVGAMFILFGISSAIIKRSK